MSYAFSLLLILGTWALAACLVPAASRYAWSVVPLLCLGASGSIVAVVIA